VTAITGTLLIASAPVALTTTGLWTFSRGYAARRAERLCLSGGLPLLLFSGGHAAASKDESFER